MAGSSSNTIYVASNVISPPPPAGPPPLLVGSLTCKPICLWPGMYHSPVTDVLWEARSDVLENINDVPCESLSQDRQMVVKFPSSSRTSIIYRFSSDPILREQYRNPWNEIRIGKLVEDLDALAGTVSYKHCFSEDWTKRSLLLVTASADKIVLKRPMYVDYDLQISGAVTWVGRSSMEIQLEATQSAQENQDPLDTVALVANFTFVCRDSRTGKSAPINAISPETERERLLQKEAEERNIMRNKKKVENKLGFENEETDRLNLNAFLADGRVFCDMAGLEDRNSILLRETSLQNSFICQPQHRNTQGQIFGGFLMRRAYELAFATAYAFIGAAPIFLEIDHVDFLRPVNVGDFLRYKSRVLFSGLEDSMLNSLINVEVVACVTKLRSSEVSNKFYFTFRARPDSVTNGLRIRNFVPGTEEVSYRVLEPIDVDNSTVPKL